MKINIKAKIVELQKKVDEFKTSEEYLNFIEFMSNFRNYSLNNQMLIYFQKESASRVAGYKTWQKLGRQVKRGESGIMILAPRFGHKEVENGNGELEEIDFTYFTAVYVFDVSQTEGKELPNINQSLEDSHPHIWSDCLKFASSKGIAVELRDDLGESNGVSQGGVIGINCRLNDTERAETCIHEITHELLHQGRSCNPEVAELEAETTAYLIMNILGIQTQSYKYLACWQKYHSLADYKILENISKMTHEVLSGLDEAKRKGEVKKC